MTMKSPMMLTPQAKEAYEQGRKAAVDGLPSSDNPYVSNRVRGLCKLWQQGWQHGRLVTNIDESDSVAIIEDE